MIRRLLVMLAFAAPLAGGLPAYAGTTARSADPLVGTWTRSGGGGYAISAAGSGFVATVTKSWTSGSGPCVHPVGQAIWTGISAQGGGKYTGENHGYRWQNNDASTCTEQLQGLTITLKSPTDLNYCVENQGCGDLTRPAPAPTATVGAGQSCSAARTCTGSGVSDTLDCGGRGTFCDGGGGNDRLTCDGQAHCDGGAGSDTLDCRGSGTFCDGGAGKDHFLW